MVTLRCAGSACAGDVRALTKGLVQSDLAQDAMAMHGDHREKVHEEIRLGVWELHPINVVAKLLGGSFIELTVSYM